MKVIFTFSDSSTYESSIIRQGFSCQEILFNRLQASDGSVGFSIPFSTTFSNKMTADINNNVLAVVYDDNNNPYATGFVKKEVGYEQKHRNQSIKITIVSKSYMLDKTLNESYAIESSTSAQIVTWLLTQAGISDIGSLSSMTTTVPLFVFNAGENIKDVLKEFCFEYSKTFYFDKNGYFQVADLFISSFTASQTFDRSNIRDRVNINVKEAEANCIRGRWTPLSLVSDTLVFEDKQNATSQYDCVIPIAANSWFGGVEDNFLKCDSTLGEVKYVKSITQNNIQSDTGITKTLDLLERTSLNQLHFTARNTTASVKNITKMQVYANAYIAKENRVDVTTYGNKEKELSLKYIQDQTTAQNFVKALADYYNSTSFTVSFSSDEVCNIGDLVTVSADGIGSFNCRIIQRTRNIITATIDYVCENIGDYTPAEIVQTVQEPLAVNIAGGQKGLDGAPGTPGADGKNAITMTSATTPSGEYNGQIGFWQGQPYMWNGSSWVKQIGDLPTDAVLHYSFDEVPDLPDGNATMVNNYNWSSYNTKVTYNSSDGTRTYEANDTSVSGFYFGFRSDSNIAGKMFVLRCKTSGTIDGTLRNFYCNESTGVFTFTKIERDGYVYLIGIIPSQATYGIRFTSLTTGAVIQVDTVYIGDGSYSTPIIDNSNGQNNAVNNGGIAVQGVSGKALGFTNKNNYVQIPKGNLTNQRSFSLWVRIKEYIAGRRIYAFGNADYTYLYNNKIYFRTWLENEKKTINAVLDFDSSFLDKWLHIVVVSDFGTSSGTKKIFINGVIDSEQTKDYDYRNIEQGSVWTLMNNSNKDSGLPFDLDDFQIFNRALSEKEVQALYQNKANTPKYYDLSDYSIEQIDDDNVVDHLTEKPQLLSKWLEIYNAKNVSSSLPTSNVSTSGEYKGVIDSANEVGVIETDAVQAYITASNALRSALWGTNGYLVDMNKDSALSGSLDSLFSTYRQTLQKARTVISEQQASSASALTIVNSNPFCLIPVNAGGTVTTYENTGLRLQVFNGVTQLTSKASSTTLSDGQWKVTASGSGIVAGSQTVGSSYIDFGNVSALTSDTATITFTITALVNGVTNTIYTTQKFSKSKEGADGRIYSLQTDNGVVKKSADGATLTPSSVTVKAYSWTGSASPALYGQADIKAYENSELVGSATQSNTLTVSPSGNYPLVVKLFKTGTSTLLDTLTIPVLQEVKGDTGGIGATGQRGSRTFSGTEIPNILPSASAYSITTASVGIEADDMPIYVGDEYINSVTFDSWTCTTEGTPTTALWTYNGRLTSDKDSANAWRFFAEGTKTKYNVKQSTIQTTEESISGPFGETATALKVLRPADVSESANSRLIPYSKTVKVDADNYTYRYSCYIRKDNSFNHTYVGIRGYEATNSVVRALDGGSVTGAYHANSANNWGYLGEWMLVVGYITASGVSTAPEGSGVYRLSTKQKVANCNNYRFKEGITQFLHTGTLIEYHASTATPTEDQTSYVYDIRLDKCDGTEPSIDDLLNRDVSVKPAGNWASGTSYQKGDVVYYETNQCSYVCISPHTASSSILPTNTTYWNLVARTPVISASKSGGVTTVKADDTTIATINDGTDAKYIEISATNGLAIVNGSPSTLPLSVTATGFTPTSYQWYKDDTAISGATSATNNATAKGVYKVVVNGTYTDRATVIEVNEGYSVSLSNENVNVPTDYSFIPLSTASSSVVFTAYRGTTQLTATTGTVASGKFTVSTPSNTKFTITQSTAGTLVIAPKTSAISGVTAFSIAINCEGKKTIYKTLSVSAVRTGDKGDTGVGISAVTEYYLRNNSSTAPTFNESTLSNWSTTASNPTSTAQYLWNAERITKSDGTTTTYEYMTPHLAMKYTANGTNGKGIVSIKNYYLATSLDSGVTTDTQGWTESVQTVSSTNRYLWNYEEITYTTGNPTKTSPAIIGTFGAVSQGNWTASHSYKVSDIVYYQGSSYICKTAHTSGSTFDSSKWNKLADKGETGNFTKRIPLYYVNDSATTPNAPTARVTSTTPATGKTWTQGKYNTYSVGKYCFTCDQIETYNASGTYQSPAWSTVVRDTEYENACVAKLRSAGQYKGTKSASFTAYTGSDNWDWFLATANFTQQSVSIVAGNVYVWNGSTWTRDTDTSHLSASMKDMMSLVDSYTSGSTDIATYATVLAQTLAVQQAFINKLFINQMQLQHSGETKGVIYGGKYNADGSVDETSSYSKGVYLDADGVFKATNGIFEGRLTNAPTERYENAGYIMYQKIWNGNETTIESTTEDVDAQIPSQYITGANKRYYIYDGNNDIVRVITIGTGIPVGLQYQFSYSRAPDTSGPWTDMPWETLTTDTWYIHFKVGNQGGTFYYTIYVKVNGYQITPDGRAVFSKSLDVNGQLNLFGTQNINKSVWNSTRQDYIGIHSDDYNNNTCTGFNISHQGSRSIFKSKSFKTQSIEAWKPSNQTYSELGLDGNKILANGILCFTNIITISTTSASNSFYNALKTVYNKVGSNYIPCSCKLVVTPQAQGGSAQTYLGQYIYLSYSSNRISLTLGDATGSLMTLSVTSSSISITGYSFNSINIMLFGY